MQLNQYVWSGNPRGFHNEGAFRPLHHDRYQPLQLGWYKIVCGGEEFLNDCRWLLSVNIQPIIRVYRPTPGAMPVDDHLQQYWRAYASVGCRWFEFYNEPNLADPEWVPEMASRVDYRNMDEVIRPLSENWLVFAEYILSLGGYPGFTALAETTTAVLWMDALLGYLRDNHRDRFVNIVNRGMYCAVHPYTLNHFYQSVPGQPGVPRPMSQYNALEGGWHFEYPYDPLSQMLDPGRTVFGGTPLTPTGDPNGLIAMGTAFNQRLQEWFGLGPVPALGTEGGIYPLPSNEPQRPDPRFPAYDRFAHGEATPAMFNWIASSAPPWMFGVCLWKEDDYYNNQLPAIARMIQVPQIGYGGRMPEPALMPPQGPGPVHGEPTFHAVVLAPGLDTAWFFEAARSYWNHFRPLVTSTWDFIQYIPYDRSLAVTVISAPDMLAAMTDAIQRRWPNVLFDPIIATGSLNSVADVLNARVWANRRFG